MGQAKSVKSDGPGKICQVVFLRLCGYLGHIPARLRPHSPIVNGEVTIPGTVWLRTAEGELRDQHPADLFDARMVAAEGRNRVGWLQIKTRR